MSIKTLPGAWRPAKLPQGNLEAGSNGQVKDFLISCAPVHFPQWLREGTGSPKMLVRQHPAISWENPVTKMSLCPNPESCCPPSRTAHVCYSSQVRSYTLWCSRTRQITHFYRKDLESGLATPVAMLLTAPKLLRYSSSCHAPPYGRIVSVPEDFLMNDGSHRHPHLQPWERENSGQHQAVGDISPIFQTVGAQGSVQGMLQQPHAEGTGAKAGTLPPLPPAAAHKPTSSTDPARRDQSADWSILVMLCPLIWPICKIRTFGSLISCPTLLLFTWWDITMAGYKSVHFYPKPLHFYFP